MVQESALVFSSERKDHKLIWRIGILQLNLLIVLLCVTLMTWLLLKSLIHHDPPDIDWSPRQQLDTTVCPFEPIACFLFLINFAGSMMSTYPKTMKCRIIGPTSHSTDGLQSISQWENAFNHPRSGKARGLSFIIVVNNDKHLSWDFSVPSRLE